jgi:cobalt/nickel transport system ATP-binding protein
MKELTASRGAGAASPVTGAVRVLEFDGVTVHYPGATTPALDRCSFAIAPGERVALLGANGSGKTTILLAAVALLPYRGMIRVNDRELDPRRPEIARREIGFLFSNPEDQLLFPRVIDDVAYTLTSRGAPQELAYDRAFAVLDRLDAAKLAERSPARLSRGQRLRAALAGALVAEPPLLLLDEPSSGLDPAGRRLLVEHLRTLPSALLIASHDIEFVRGCCDRYLLIDGGKVSRSGAAFEEVEL